MAHTLPALPYAHDALEPHIDVETMEIHHGKHHQGYVNNLNAALEGLAVADMDVHELLSNLDQVPEAKRQAVINNGGGHANHSLFWSIMSPNGGELGGEIAAAITSTFGSHEAAKEQFATAATTRSSVPVGHGLSSATAVWKSTPLQIRTARSCRDIPRFSESMFGNTHTI